MNKVWWLWKGMAQSIAATACSLVLRPCLSKFASCTFNTSEVWRMQVTCSDANRAGVVIYWTNIVIFSAIYISSCIKNNCNGSVKTRMQPRRLWCGGLSWQVQVHGDATMGDKVVVMSLELNQERASHLSSWYYGDVSLTPKCLPPAPR